jgi:hypothetical protein
MAPCSVSVSEAGGFAQRIDNERWSMNEQRRSDGLGVNRESYLLLIFPIIHRSSTIAHSLGKAEAGM